jgi:hypothetical protein
MARIIVTKKRTLIDAEILATSEAAATLQGYPHRKSRTARLLIIVMRFCRFLKRGDHSLEA